MTIPRTFGLVLFLGVIFSPDGIRGAEERTAVEFRFEVNAETPGAIESKFGGEVIFLSPRVGLNGSDIESAKFYYSPQGWAVSITLKKVSAEKFAKLTRASIGKRLAIVVGGKVRVAPEIRSEIENGAIEVSGGISMDEASRLSESLNQAK